MTAAAQPAAPPETRSTTVTTTSPRPTTLAGDRRRFAGPVDPRTSTLTPLDATQVRLTGGFWAEKQQLNADVVLRHCEDWMERIGWIRNFDLAAAGRDQPDEEWPHSGIEFVDSEVYKLLEGMAWELGRQHDPDLQRRYDDLVERVSGAQDDDGYLHTSFGRPWQRARWSDLEWGHELYSMGHLLQAVVAAERTGTGPRLVEVGRRLAEHLWREFGPEGRVAICGHPEIEVALAELGRALDEPRWVELARLFVDRRGRGLLAEIEYGAEYFQDDRPVREADVLRGHAVRALYLAAGALDVAVETRDDELADAVRRQWEATVAHRTYVTGGMGSHHQDEAFGADHELPPDRAYSETCAGIASTMLSWRLLLADGDARYADLIERTLLNVVLASPREDGRAFFYTNTLHQRTEGTVPDELEVNARALSSLRAPWFEVSCCPTNVARTLASVEQYFATRTDDGVQLHQYGSYDVDVELPDGTAVALSVASGYPFDGRVEVTWREATDREVELTLRVPSWTEGAAVTLVAPDGEVSRHATSTVVVRQAFAAGDVVVLDLPTRASWVHPDPRIDAVRGQVAVQRGPLVLALESVDLPSGSVADVLVDTRVAPVTTPTGARVALTRSWTRPAPWPYGQSVAATVEQLGRVDLVPYASWGNRGPSTMRVWLPVGEGRG